MRRRAERMASVSGAVVMLLACSARRELPPPVQPFTVTPEAAFRTGPPALEPGPELSAFEQRAFELENGMRVIVVERHELPVVAVAFANRAARDAEAASQIGLSALTLFTVDGATRMVSGETLSNLTVDGRRLRPILSTDGIAVEVQALPWGVDEAIGIIARWVRYPALDATAFELARSLQLDRIFDHENELGSHLRAAARERLYGTGHFLALSELGTHDNLARFRTSDVASFYRRNYQPATSALFVTGDVAADQVLEMARSAFGGWAPSATPAVVDPAPVVPNHEELEIDGIGAPLGQAPFVAVLPCPGHADADALAGDVLATVLGQMTLSRTAVRLRHETGSSYAGQATCMQRRHFGEMLIEVSSSTDRAALTLETLLEQLGKLANEQVRERELETAKSRVLAQYAGSIATVPGLARALAMLFASGAPSDFHATLPARARALDAERLRKVAARFFDVRRIGVAVAGDPNPLHEELDDRAKIHWSYLVERPR